MSIRIGRRSSPPPTKAPSAEQTPAAALESQPLDVSEPTADLPAAPANLGDQGHRAGRAALLMSPAGRKVFDANREQSAAAAHAGKPAQVEAADDTSDASKDGLARLKNKGATLLGEMEQLYQAARRARTLGERMEGNNSFLVNGYARDAFKLETSLKQRANAFTTALASDNAEVIASQYLRSQKLARQAAGSLERFQSDVVADANELRDTLAPIRTFKETFDKVLRTPKELLDAVGLGSGKGALAKGAGAASRLATLTKAPGMMVAAGGDLRTMAESLGSIGERTHRAVLEVREGARTIERAARDPARARALETVWHQAVGNVVTGDPAEALRTTELGALVAGRGDTTERIAKFLGSFDGNVERAMTEVANAVTSTIRIDRLPDTERFTGLWTAVARGKRSDVREQLTALGVDGAAADALLTRQGMNDLRALRRSVTGVVEAARGIAGDVATLRHAVAQAGLAYRGELAPQADVDAVEQDRTPRR